MAKPSYHLAQINIARALAPLDHPSMSGFISQLDHLNRLAEQSPGFVWRLKATDGMSAAYVRAYADERVIINISVWESLESLRHYVYRSGHGQAFRDRRQWFEPMGHPSVALWWIPAGTSPTVAEAKQRLEALQRDGPTAYSFTFKKSFPLPPESEGADTGSGT